MSTAGTPPEYWPEAVRVLKKADPVLGRIIGTHEKSALTSRGDAFQTLARAITGQQISVKAADSVWARLEAALGGSVTPEAMLATPIEVLRAAGLSAQKVNYLAASAEYFARERARMRQWMALGDDALIAELTALKGVGKWTAEMMLIFHFQRPDVFPLADLGLLKAIARHYNGGKDMEKHDIIAISSQWAPWRTVATWYLWRDLDPIPILY